MWMRCKVVLLAAGFAKHGSVTPIAA